MAHLVFGKVGGQMLRDVRTALIAHSDLCRQAAYNLNIYKIGICRFQRKNGVVVMHSTEELHQWQREVNWHTRLTGFVPTMGALHQGHLSLIHEAASHSDLVVVSVLVNPTQFNDSEDFKSYPRTLESDARKAASAGAHALFAPTAEDLYRGQPTAPRVDWGPVTNAFEGAHRPGHFDGVVAVVDLLFEAVKPHVAVFGEKDLQGGRGEAPCRGAAS